MSNEEGLLTRYLPLRTIANDDHSSDKICKDVMNGQHVLIRRTSKRYIVNNGLVNNLDLQVKLFSKATDRWWMRPVEYLQNAEFVYEVYQCDENAVNMSELVETELTEQEIKWLAAQMLCCIESLHTTGYFSGCLSPRSFVLCGDGILRLCSVMYLKPIDNSKQKERRKSMFHYQRHFYVAPQMLDQMADEGPNADYWMLGVTLYNLYHEKEPFQLNDFDSPAKLVASIQMDEQRLPKDAVSLMRGLLRRNYDRLGRNNNNEVRRHSYFGKSDWSFKNSAEKMADLLVLRHSEQNQVLWRQLYFYDIPASTLKDSIYFPLFRPLPGQDHTAAHIKQQPTFENLKEKINRLLDLPPQNQCLQKLWRSICM